MKTYCENISPVSFTPTAATGRPPPAPGEERGGPKSPALPEGWKRVATGMRGTRLFRVTPRSGGKVFWEAEVTLNEKTLRRRFSSELHARAWLTVGSEPRQAVNPFDREEIHGRFRTACVVRS